MREGPEWFAPKRYGYGSGLPISWQGWAVTILFLAIVFGVTFTFEDKPLVILATVVLSAIAMLFIAARTTKGGWRWRWGEKD